MLCHMDQAQCCLKDVSEQPRTPALIFLALFSLSQFFIFTTLIFFEMNSLTPFTLNWLQFCWFYTPTRYLWYGFLNNSQLDQQIPLCLFFFFSFFLFVFFLISLYHSYSYRSRLASSKHALALPYPQPLCDLHYQECSVLQPLKRGISAQQYFYLYH